MGGEASHEPGGLGGRSEPEQHSEPDQFTTNIGYKIYHISKTKNRKKNSCYKKSISEYFASFVRFFFIYSNDYIINDHISKTKNRKINFSLVSEHCVTF